VCVCAPGEFGLTKKARTRLEKDEQLRWLAELLPRVMVASRAENTVKKYAGAANRWRRWTERHKISPFPAEPLYVALYLVDLMQTADTPAPILAAFYGISWALQLGGWPDVTQAPCIRRVREAARRILEHTPSPKKPIKKKHIRRIGRITDRNNLVELQTLTLMVLGFASFMRWDDLRSVFADEIVVRRTYMALFLERRKNDQFREGSWVFVGRWSGRLCPVALTEELLQKGKHRGHVKLFRKVTKGKKRTYLRGELSYKRALEWVRDALVRVDLNPKQYGLHSLRAGGATAAATLGLPDRLVQRQGGWRSERSMHRYFQESLPNLTLVSRTIGAHRKRRK